MSLWKYLFELHRLIALLLPQRQQKGNKAVLEMGLVILLEIVLGF